VVLKFKAHLVKCRLKYGLCNPPEGSFIIQQPRANLFKYAEQLNECESMQ